MIANVVHRSPRLWIAHEAPLFITIWSAPPDLADVVILGDRQRDAIARGVCLNLAWIRPPAVTALPDAEVRARTRALLDEHGHRIAANAQVVDASGFTGAAVRALLTSLGVITGAPHPSRVCRTLEEGIEWLARRPEADRSLVDRAPMLAARLRALVP